MIDLNDFADREITFSVRSGELALLLSFGVLGVYAVISSQGLPATAPLQPEAIGPRLFPLVTGLGMIVTSLWLLVTNVVAQRRDESKESAMLELQGKDILRVLAYLATVSGYLLILRTVGYLIATLVLLAFMARLLKYENPAKIVLFSVIVTIGLYVFFVGFLSVALPDPILGPLLGGII